MDPELVRLSETVGWALKERALTLAAAESCTGGWVAQVLTHTAGSSAWFDRGFVTYSNAAKTELLDVAAEILAEHGAVSRPTAEAMVGGVLRHSVADLALAITGIAGPGGGSPEKPVGTVCFAWGWRNRSIYSEIRHFAGDREHVRRQAVVHALAGVLVLADAKLVP